MISKVGISFHAISAATNSIFPVHLTEVQTDSLQMQIESLQEKLEYWRNFAESEGRARLVAEEKLQRYTQVYMRLGQRYKRMHTALRAIAMVTQENLDQTQKRP